MSFNDPFLKDLENLSDSEDESPAEDSQEEVKQGDHLSEDSYAEPQEEAHTDRFSRLKANIKFNQHLETIKEFSNQDSKDENILIDLINKTNEFLQQMGPDLLAVHKTARDIYLKRLPELESLIMDPVDFAKTVLALGNIESVDNIAHKLAWLPNTLVMSITVAFSTQAAMPLDGASWIELSKVCDQILFLHNSKSALLDFLKSRMHMIAPNTAAVVGPEVCAKLIAAAGGILELSRTPACNIQVLGSQKKALNGMSTASAKLHRGHLGELDLVKNAPSKDQIKIVRMLASKTALTSRIDVCKTCPSGEEGIKMKQGILARYAKISAPGQSRLAKILPKPDEKKKTKRAGRKYQSQKKKYEMTMHRKMQNTMAFGAAAQKEDFSTGKTFGLLGVGGGLKVNKQIKKPNRPQVPGWGDKSSTSFGGRSNAGLVSSVAMSSSQGMELFNPALLKQQVNEAKKDNYFSSKAGFTTVLQEKRQ